MSRILLRIGIVVLLVLVVLVVSVTVPFTTGTARSGPRPDSPSYAVPGPHPVGVRNLVMEEGEASLPMTLWYPALNDEHHEAAIRYRYTMKMGAPLGAVPFATFTGRAIDGAPYALATGPYPLVILSPGFSIGASTYAWLAEHLASHGFVVLAPEHQEQFDAKLDGLWQATVTRPHDILAVLAHVDEQSGAGGAFAGLVDAETVAVIGHSYGGYTTLAAGGAQIDTDSFATLCATAYEVNDPNVWLCDELLPHMADMAELAGLESMPEGLWHKAWSDPRIDALVPLAGDAFYFGQDGLAEITVPVMAIGGTRDSDSPYQWGTYPTYEYVSSATKARIALVDAEHMIFTAPCEAMPLLLRFVSAEFCSDPGWDRNYAHDLIKHFTTAFLLSELKQDAGAAATLAPAAVDFAGVTYEAQGY